MDIDNLSRSELIQIIHGVSEENITLIDRDKNFNFRTSNNITVCDIVNAVKNLEISDIVKGPVQDHDPNRKHPLWIFKKVLFGVICYIKIKVIDKGKKIIVVSFHEDE